MYDWGYKRGNSRQNVRRTVCVVVANQCLVHVGIATAWFRLPKWFTVYGILTEEKHSSGPGAIEVRILGAMFLGGFAWVIYDAFFSR